MTAAPFALHYPNLRPETPEYPVTTHDGTGKGAHARRKDAVKRRGESVQATGAASGIRFLICFLHGLDKLIVTHASCVLLGFVIGAWFRYALYVGTLAAWVHGAAGLVRMESQSPMAGRTMVLSRKVQFGYRSHTLRHVSSMHVIDALLRGTFLSY